MGGAGDPRVHASRRAAIKNELVALYRHLSGEKVRPPETWTIAELCADWGALPFEGSVLEQPLALMVGGAQLRAFAKAYAIYERDQKNAPGSIRDLVLLTARESALRHERGE